MPSIYRPFYRDPVSGIPTAIPDGAILNIGGTTHSTFTVNGQGVMLADGSTSNGGPSVIFNLQTVYENTDDGNGFASITMEAGRDLIIYDDTNPSVFFKIDSTTGKVTISGDLEVQGTNSVINTTVTDADHWLISPNNGSTIALLIEPDFGVTQTSPFIDVKNPFGGPSIFTVDPDGLTTLEELTVNQNINVSGLVDGVDVAALDTLVQNHIFISSNKHQASEINLTPGSLLPFNVPSIVTETQEAIEYLAEQVDNLNTSVSNNSGYTHEQLVASDTWIINHGQNTMNFVNSLFDGTGEMIIPDKFIVIDSNQVRIEFGTAITGRCNFMFYQTL